MKLSPAQLAGFLKSPPSDIAAVLIYGPDDGLVRERAELLIRGVLGPDRDDPFRFTTMDGDEAKRDPARLNDEAAQLGMFGGRRVLRVRGAGDALTVPLRGIFTGAGPAALLVLEGTNLEKASSLRRYCEGADNIAVIACYADGPREVLQTIREVLGQNRVTADEDAISYLQHHLGGDRMVTRGELEKLCLYAGEGGRLSFHEVAAQVGDSSILAIDDVIYDAVEGKAAIAEAELRRLFREGEEPVRILRAALRHAQRLHLAGAEMAGGLNIEGAMAKLRPPVFFKLADRFKGQLRAWPPLRTERLLALISEAEDLCKRTGYPDKTICLQTFVRMSGV